eukprot:3221665-Pleurochrysis_carterae.AAC.1
MAQEEAALTTTISPRAALIRRLRTALGEQDTVPTPDVSRALTFGSAGDSEQRGTSSRRLRTADPRASRLRRGRDWA